jgi:hypothetical protein
MKPFRDATEATFTSTTIPGWLRDDVAHGHQTPVRPKREPWPLGASVGDDLVNALNLATSQSMLDVQVEADERLREADRRVLLGRRLDRVRIDHVLMTERDIGSPQRVRATRCTRPRLRAWRQP